MLLRLTILFIILSSFAVQAATTTTSADRLILQAKDSLSSMTNTSPKLHVVSDRSTLTALVLCVFMGPLGIHRLYLGTSAVVAVAYIVTGGGCGLIWVGDAIALTKKLIKHEPLEKYEENRRFIMWL